MTVFTPVACKPVPPSHVSRISRIASFITFCSIASAAIAATQTFSSDGTYLVPVGTSLLQVNVLGAGGGGGGADTGQGGNGGAGGGVTATMSVEGGKSATITVGAGGAQGALTYGPNNSGPNGDKSVSNSGGKGGVGAGAGGAGGDASTPTKSDYSGSGGGGGAASALVFDGSVIRAGGGGGGGGGSKGPIGNPGTASTGAPISNADCATAADGAIGIANTVYTQTVGNVQVADGGGGGGGGGGYLHQVGTGGKAGQDNNRNNVEANRSGGGGAGGSCTWVSGGAAITGAAFTAGAAGGAGAEANDARNPPADGHTPLPATAGQAGSVKLRPVPALSIACMPNQLTTPGQESVCTISSNVPLDPGETLNVPLTPPASLGGDCTAVAMTETGTATCKITAPTTLLVQPVTETVEIQPATGSAYTLLQPKADVSAGQPTVTQGGAQAVPASGPWALAALSGLLGFTAWRRRNPGASQKN